MHKHYIQQSVKVTKSSTRKAGGAVFRACPLNTLFFISLWLFHCGDHSCAGTPLEVSVPISTDSQQVTGLVSSPFAEGRCRSRKTELKRSLQVKDGVLASLCSSMEGRYLTQSEPCCRNIHMVLVETWP